MGKHILLLAALLWAVPLIGQDGPIAEGKPKFLGNVSSPAQAADFTDYWNQVTPENAGKWGSAEPARDVMNWSQLDAAYALAKDNGFPFKLHCLIWGNQQPDWIASLLPAEQLEEIGEWFQALADRYPGIDVVEVVNEPINDPPNSPASGGGNYIGALGGTGGTGYDWVLTAFTMARQYFPDAQLMLNEYNILNNTGNATNYKALIELLQDGNLIDQIGVQGHSFTTKYATAAKLDETLGILAATGLPIFVTEMDIEGTTDQIQLDEYKRVFPVLWEHPAVRGITLWGWRPGIWVANANLINADGVTERPALIWLREYVMNTVLGDRDIVHGDHIRIFPNPATDGFFIEGVDDIERIELFDMHGRLIRAGRPKTGYFALGQNVPQGIYLALVYQGSRLFVKRIIFE